MSFVNRQQKRRRRWRRRRHRQTSSNMSIITYRERKTLTTTTTSSNNSNDNDDCESSVAPNIATTPSKRHSLLNDGGKREIETCVCSPAAAAAAVGTSIASEIEWFGWFKRSKEIVIWNICIYIYWSVGKKYFFLLCQRNKQRHNRVNTKKERKLDL